MTYARCGITLLYDLVQREDQEIFSSVMSQCTLIFNVF